MTVYFRVIDDNHAQVIINCKSICVVTKKETDKLQRVLRELNIEYESVDMRGK
jgi:hypothetical protein